MKEKDTWASLTPHWRHHCPHQLLWYSGLLLSEGKGFLLLSALTPVAPDHAAWNTLHEVTLLLGSSAQCSVMQQEQYCSLWPSEYNMLNSTGVSRECCVGLWTSLFNTLAPRCHNSIYGCFLSGAAWLQQVWETLLSVLRTWRRGIQKLRELSQGTLCWCRDTASSLKSQ